ncbi:MAG: hypothetical protein ACYSRR_03495 [Planctomycetota bacterium]|jgi:hypothetical protein
MGETDSIAQKKKLKKISLLIAILLLLLSFAGFCTQGITSIAVLVLGMSMLIWTRGKSGWLKTKVITIIALVLSVLVLLPTALNSIPSVKIAKILSAGRLSDLPESATEIKVEGWSSMFAGMDYIKFRATSEDIEKFIKQSPSINNLSPEIFSREHMYLPSSELTDFGENYYKHKYYVLAGEPPWYEPVIRIKGRMYEIPGDPNMRDHNYGSVIIDDETNTVFITVIWS